MPDHRSPLELDLPPPSIIRDLLSLARRAEISTIYRRYIIILGISDALLWWRDRVPTMKVYRVPYAGLALEIGVLAPGQYQTHKYPFNRFRYSGGELSQLRDDEPISSHSIKPESAAQEKTMSVSATTKPAPAPAPTKKVPPMSPKKKAAVEGLASPETRKSIVESFRSALKSNWTFPDGKTRYIGFLPATVKNALAWIRCNVANRPVNWKQAETLMTSFRATEDGKPAWVYDANVYVMSWDDIVADSQHRIIAFILAFGNRQEIEELLYLLNAMPLSGFKLKIDGETNSPHIDPTQPLPVPFKTWSLTDKAAPENIAIPVILNADPRVSDKADTDQAKRTGADQLARNAETGALLAQWDLAPAELQQILRYMYLRVLPPTATAKEKNPSAKYGSLRKGGNIHPDRYPVLAINFQEYIEQAMDVIHGTPDARFRYDCLGIQHPVLVGTFALAIQGGVPKKNLVRFLEQWAPAELADDGEYYELPKTGAAATYTRDMNETMRKPVIGNYERGYLISYFVQQDNVNPDIRSAEKLLELIGGVEFEQTQANRLPGWDSEGCPGVISRSLAMKIKQEAKKAAKKSKA